MAKPIELQATDQVSPWTPLADLSSVSSILTYDPARPANAWAQNELLRGGRPSGEGGSFGWDFLLGLSGIECGQILWARGTYRAAGVLGPIAPTRSHLNFKKYRNREQILYRPSI